MAQSTVFSQVIKLIPRSHFESIVFKHKADKGIRSLNSWTWFGALLFGQLSGHDSIRAIERLFASNNVKMQKLGMGPVRRSTLADANRTRPLEVLEELFQLVLAKAQAVAPKNGFRFKGQILSLDSTTINLCLSLSPWAKFHHTQGALKLHTAIDIAGDLPQFVVVTEGKRNDVRVAKQQITFTKGTTVVFDRGYSDYAWLNSLNKAGVWFVTRTKRNTDFKVIESRATDRTRGHICDQVIYLKGRVSSQRYKGKLRRISYRDPDTGKRLTFLTNRFDLATQTICDLYQARWKVELFFKTMKQHLRIKKFLGTSAHAVKAQILVALIAYLLIQILRLSFQTSISMSDTMAVVGTLLLLNEPLQRILGELPRVTRHPPPSQLVFNL